MPYNYFSNFMQCMSVWNVHGRVRTHVYNFRYEAQVIALSTSSRGTLNLYAADITRNIRGVVNFTRGSNDLELSSVWFLHSPISMARRDHQLGASGIRRVRFHIFCAERVDCYAKNDPILTAFDRHHWTSRSRTSLIRRGCECNFPGGRGFLSQCPSGCCSSTLQFPYSSWLSIYIVKVWLLRQVQFILLRKSLHLDNCRGYLIVPEYCMCSKLECFPCNPKYRHYQNGTVPTFGLPTTSPRMYIHSKNWCAKVAWPSSCLQITKDTLRFLLINHFSIWF